MSRVRELNDTFRRTFEGGQVLITAGVSALHPDIVAQALQRVRTFDAFTEDNDPHGEHDFGNFEFAGHTFFWKIDCYDNGTASDSENPAASDTLRVLTIMLAEEY